MNRAAPFIGLALIILGGCTTPRLCPSEGMAQLICQATRGDKFAQLALGKALESGSGVTRDFKSAANWYRAAAAPVSGTTYVYSPPVGQSRGQVIPVRTGSDHPGLAEARNRLARLYRDGRGVKRDTERAAKLEREAAEQGYIGE